MWEGERGREGEGGEGGEGWGREGGGRKVEGGGREGGGKGEERWRREGGGGEDGWEAYINNLCRIETFHVKGRLERDKRGRRRK